MRTTRETRERLEASARASGRSLVQEVEHLVEEGLAKQEQAGGAVVQELARLWHAAFLRGLSLGARARNLPAEQDPSELLRDPLVYRTAVHAGTDALLAAQPLEFEPDAGPAEIKQFLEMLDQFSCAAARGAPIKRAALGL
jgi:hypothetical protein